MANRIALKAFADANPGKTDAELVTLYSAATVVVRQPIVPIADVLQWSGSGPLDSIDAAQGFTHEEGRRPSTSTAPRTVPCSASSSRSESSRRTNRHRCWPSET
jgi:hypothetical protein